MTRPHTLPQIEVALALEAGGSSQRMGGDKAFAPFNGTTLFGQLLARLAPGFGRVFIVTNEPARYRGFGVPVVTDVIPGCGSLMGIYSAILASPTYRVLCLACDLPFVTPRLLEALVRGSTGYDVLVPRHGIYLEPLCAVYSKNCADPLEDMLRRGERRVAGLYDRVRTGYLDVDTGQFGDPGILFMNVNTPEELEAARRLASGTGEHLASRGGAGEHMATAALLSPRVRRFMAETPVSTVSFVGKKKSGKTSVLLGVIPELAARGYRVAVLKHDVHGFDVDVPGTDSYRLRQAGAVVTGVSSPEKYVWISGVDSERSLLELAGRISEPVDLLITEGFKREAAPKIEVSRRARSSRLVTPEDELLAIVSDQDFPGYKVPRFELDDYSGIAGVVEDLVRARVFARWQGG